MVGEAVVGACIRPAGGLTIRAAEISPDTAVPERGISDRVKAGADAAEEHELALGIERDRGGKTLFDAAQWRGVGAAEPCPGRGPVGLIAEKRA